MTGEHFGLDASTSLHTIITLEMVLKFEAEAKSLRPRPKGPKAEVRGYEALTGEHFGLDASTFSAYHYSARNLHSVHSA